MYIPEVVMLEAGASCYVASRTYSDFMKRILLSNNRCHDDSCLFHSVKNKYSFRLGALLSLLLFLIYKAVFYVDESLVCEAYC